MSRRWHEYWRRAHSVRAHRLLFKMERNERLRDVHARALERLDHPKVIVTEGLVVRDHPSVATLSMVPALEEEQEMADFSHLDWNVGVTPSWDEPDTPEANHLFWETDAEGNIADDGDLPFSS